MPRLSRAKRSFIPLTPPASRTSCAELSASLRRNSGSNPEAVPTLSRSRKIRSFSGSLLRIFTISNGSSGILGSCFRSFPCFISMLTLIRPGFLEIESLITSRVPVSVPITAVPAIESALSTSLKKIHQNQAWYPLKTYLPDNFRIHIRGPFPEEHWVGDVNLFWT